MVSEKCAAFTGNEVFKISVVLRELADEFDVAFSWLSEENAQLRASLARIKRGNLDFGRKLPQDPGETVAPSAPPVRDPKDELLSSVCDAVMAHELEADRLWWPAPVPQQIQVMAEDECSDSVPRYFQTEALHTMLEPESQSIGQTSSVAPLHPWRSSNVLVRMARGREQGELPCSQEIGSRPSLQRHRASSQEITLGHILQRGWTTRGENMGILSDASEEPVPVPYAERLLTHPYFQSLTAIIILMNAAHTAIQADQKEKADDLPGLFVADLFFSAFFVAEIILRLAIYQRRFFAGSLMFVGSNIFDACIAAIAVATSISSLMDLPQSSVAALTTARMLRIFKLTRAFRIFKIFRELAVLVEGIVHSCRVLFWGCFFMLMITFVVGIFTTFLFGELIADATIDETTRTNVEDLFGTTLRSMFTLYQIQTGDSWASAIARPIMEHRPSSAVFFTCYFAFVNTCVLNVIIAIVVGQVMESTILETEEEAIRKAQQEEGHKLADIIDMFNEISKGDSNISRDAWKNAISQESTLRVLSRLKINSSSAADDLFDILDIDSSGQIDREEFIKGLNLGTRDVRMLDISGNHLDVMRLQTMMNTELLSIKSNVRCLLKHWEQDGLKKSALLECSV